MRFASAILLCSILTAGLHAQTSAPAEESKEETVVVKRGDIITFIDLDGYFEAVDSTEVRVRPRQYQGDLLVKWAAAPGTPVRKGEKVLEVEANQLRKQLAAAENELTTAQANLSKAQADVQLGEAGDALAMRIQQTELSNAESALKWWEEVDGAHLIKGAELAVKVAKDNVEDQDDELEQLRKMYKSEELTSATADIVVKRAIRQLERAQIQKGMQEAREGKVKGFDYNVQRQKLVFAIEQQKQQLAELVAKQQQQSQLRKTALTTAQQAVDKVQTRVDELTQDLENFTVTAPFDGVVYAGDFLQGRWQNANPRILRPDEKLTAGQVVMTVAPTGKLRLVLDVPESRLQQVRDGLKVRVMPAAYPDMVADGVCEAPPAAGIMRDNSYLFPTPVKVEQLDPRLGVGQRATARINVEARGVLVVPASAVSKNRVKVRAADGSEQWRDIVTGHSDGEMMEVRRGLSDGEVILTKAGK